MAGIMELLQVGNKITECIEKLGELAASLHDLSANRDQLVALYERYLAERIIELRNSENKTPTTIIEKIARGQLWKDCLQKDMAESAYRNQLKIIEIVQAQLNGYQSIYKWLDKQ